MALSQNSTILISDISTALSGKQDALGYVPIKSVNGTTADSSGNVAISVSAPVTSVNGMTGAVTISSVTKAETVNALPVYSYSSPLTAPSGGTWAYIMTTMANNDFGLMGASAGNVAGGTQINSRGSNSLTALFVRTA